MKNRVSIGRAISAAGVAALGIPTLQNQFNAIQLIPPDWMRWFVLAGLIMMVIGPVISVIFDKPDTES